MSEPTDTNVAICEALGFDANDLNTLVVRVNKHELPSIEVEYSFSWIQQHKPGFSRVARQYTLIPSTEREQA